VDNDESRYPAKVLDAWKTLREHAALSAIGQTTHRAVETEAQRKEREILKWKGQRGDVGQNA